MTSIKIIEELSQRKGKNGDVISTNARRNRRSSGKTRSRPRNRRNPPKRRQRRANGSSVRMDNRAARGGLATGLGEQTLTFAEAVTNPFSNAAIGAVMPDRWMPATIPGMDRVTLTFDPASYRSLDTTLRVEGFIFAFVPRSLSMGWKASIYGSSPVQAMYSIKPMLSNFTEPNQDPRGDMYALWVGVIGYFTDDTTTRIINWNPESAIFQPGFNVMPFARHDILEGTISGARICGAGLKAFAAEPPLTTGGTVFGGWLPLMDLQSQLPPGSVELDRSPGLTTITSGGHVKIRPEYEQIEMKNDTTKYHHQSNLMKRIAHKRNPATNAAFRDKLVTDPHATITGANFQDLLRYRVSYTGVQGCTVRYSPLQSPVQEEVRVPFDSAVFAGIDVQSGLVNPGTGPGNNDLISGADMVPCIVWKFNSTNGTPDNYTVFLEARVHLQCVPDADNPFMTKGIIPDPNFNNLSLLLENKDVYPVVATGHSFKSFLKGVDRSMKTLMGVTNAGVNIVKTIGRAFF